MTVGNRRKTSQPPPIGGPSAGVSVPGGRVFLLSGMGRRHRPPGKGMKPKVCSGPWSRGAGPEAQGQAPETPESQGSQKTLREKGRRLPRELRIKLYDEVNELRKQGLSHNKIIDRIQKKHGIRLPRSTVSYWLRQIYSPYNGRYIPTIELLKPSKELAYIIGTVLGDGYAIKKKPANIDIIGLTVKDKEFADEFAKCFSKVLGRQKKPSYIKTTKLYVVDVGSKTLYELLKKPVNLDRLKRYIEHDEECMAAFLRGLFDSEGSIDKNSHIRINNTNLRLLSYAKDLLHRLGIETTGPWLNYRKGIIRYDYRMRKNYTAKKDCYRLYIRASYNQRFHKTIGFTIERKRRRLEEYLRRRQSQTPSPLFPRLNNYLDREGYLYRGWFPLPS